MAYSRRIPLPYELFTPGAHTLARSFLSAQLIRRSIFFNQGEVMTPEQQREFDRLFRLKYRPIDAKHLRARNSCMPGSRWGHLLVLADIPGVPKHGLPKRHVFTLCEKCGTLSDKAVNALIYGQATSCGCIRSDMAKTRVWVARAAKESRRNETR